MLVTMFNIIIVTLKHNSVLGALIIIIIGCCVGRLSYCTNMEGEGEEHKSQTRMLYSFTAYALAVSKDYGFFYGTHTHTYTHTHINTYTHTHIHCMAYMGTTSHGIKGNGIG